VGGERINVDADSSISNNATFTGETGTVAGRVSKHLHAFYETVELDGQVSVDLEAFASRVRSSGDA